MRILAIAAALTAALTLTTAPAHAATGPATAAPVAVAVQPARIAVEALALPAVASYTVVPGDTLGAIAARFCGTFSAFGRLAAASGIANPDLIYPGQTIHLAGCTAAAASPAPTGSRSAPPPPAPSSAADRAVAFALAQVGKPYIWAAAGPNGYDCSGLVMAAYAQVGIRLPHYTYTMINYGSPVSRSDLRPGDAVWPYGDLSHVVLYIGDGRIVEAPYPGARVSTRNLYAFAAARRFA